MNIGNRGNWFIIDTDQKKYLAICRRRQEDNQYTLPEELYPDQNSCWRIEEFNANAILTKGHLWSFFGTVYLIIDNMEASEAIW